MKEEFGTPQNKKRTVIWAIIFIIISCLSVFAVSKIVRGFSFAKLQALLNNASPVFLCLAFVSMLGFIIFEALSIRAIIRSFGYRSSFRSCLVYSGADLFFSAITPSATGGQPASGYFMIRDGITSSCTTVSLLINLAMFTLSKIITALLAIILIPGVFNLFSTTGRVLIGIGAVTLFAVVIAEILVALKENFIIKVGNLVISLCCKIKLMKDRAYWENKFNDWISDYIQCATEIMKRKKVLVKSLIFAVLQNICQVAITMFMYIAISINTHSIGFTALLRNGIQLMGGQSLINISSAYVPIPGAIGYTDIMMLSSFESIMPSSVAASLALLTRGISFYGMVILSLIIVLIAGFIAKRK